MPPQIATCVFIGFIALLLRLETNRGLNISPAIWIAVAWLILLATRPVAQWLSLDYGSVSELEAYESGNPVDRTIMIILLIAALSIVTRRKGAWGILFRNNRWLIILAVYCLLSVGWSDFPLTAAKRWIKGFGGLIIILIVLSERHPAEAIKAVVRRVVYLLIPLSVLVIKYYREWGVTYNPWDGTPNYAGVATDKNGLGRLCVLAGLWLVWESVGELRGARIGKGSTKLMAHGLLCAMVLWLLIKANSATSYACLIAGIAIYLGIGVGGLRSSVKRIEAIFILIVIIAYVSELTVGILEPLIKSLGRDMTLTARTKLWTELLNFETNPIIGVGYDTFWLGDRMAVLWQMHWWQPNESHNGYLDVYLELGVIGLLLWLAVMVCCYKNTRRSLVGDFEVGRIQFSFLGVLLLYNITEASLKFRTMMTFVFFLFCLYSKKGQDR